MAVNSSVPTVSTVMLSNAAKMARGWSGPERVAR
jgi:hypothetical protein